MHIQIKTSNKSESKRQNTEFSRGKFSNLMNKNYCIAL